VPDGLKWNALTNMSRDTAETSATDFFTLPKLGRVSGSTDVSTRPCIKSGRVMDRVEIDAYARWRRQLNLFLTRMTVSSAQISTESADPVIVTVNNLRVKIPNVAESGS